MKSKLTENEYFLANRPDYLNLFPEVKRELITEMKKHKPDECLSCIFLGRKQEGVEYFCPLKTIKFEYGKRAEGCPLDEE